MSAYEKNDPKHPGYAERAADLADTARAERPQEAASAGADS